MGSDPRTDSPGPSHIHTDAHAPCPSSPSLATSSLCLILSPP